MTLFNYLLVIRFLGHLALQPIVFYFYFEYHKSASIQWCIEEQDFWPSYDLAHPGPLPHPPLSSAKLSLFFSIHVCRRLSPMTGGAKSYDDENAWSSIDHSILSATNHDLLYHTPLFMNPFHICLLVLNLSSKVQLSSTPPIMSSFHELLQSCLLVLNSSSRSELLQSCPINPNPTNHVQFL